MENKTDPYVGFDPTQMQGQGCCGEKIYDFQTGTWVVRKQPPTCEELLESANSELSQAKQQRDEALAKLALCEKKQADCPPEPVYSIGDVHLFDANKCGVAVSTLGGDSVGVETLGEDTTNWLEQDL